MAGKKSSPSFQKVTKKKGSKLRKSNMTEVSKIKVI